MVQPDPSGAITISPAFLRFFNDAARFSEAVYPNGATDPKLLYTLAPVKSDQIDSMNLTIDGQTAKHTSKQFTWPGSGRGEVKLTINLKGGSPLEAQDFPPGLWSVFRFFADADKTEGNVIAWNMKSGKAGRVLVTYRFTVDPAVLSKEFLSGMSCVSQVAK